MIVGFFVIALYLRATATGFHWGRASRWSQYALMACAVTVVLTMVTMGYTRETARRVDNEPGFLIYECVTLDQKIVGKNCPAHPITEGASE
jgi:cytochrome d ubiquinol oxidase subunit I